MLVVDVPRQTAERLNAASAKRRWYPFDDHVIDWAVPITDDWAYMPEGQSVFSDSGILGRLSEPERSFVERWEMTQKMRNVAHGEHLLNQGILAMLWTIDPYDPSYRFLLHEVAEECQHMAMFNAWVRLNDDIITTGAGETAWGKTAAEFTMGLATTLPEAFWVNVLLFEFVGDDLNQAMRADDGRPLHPILVQIGQAHTAEEARHIAYARKWLEEGMPTLSEEEVARVQGIAELGAQALVTQQTLLPVGYSDQLSPYMTAEEFDEARGTSPASRAMLRQLKKLLDEFESLRVIRPDTMRRWEDQGVWA